MYKAFLIAAIMAAVFITTNTIDAYAITTVSSNTYSQFPQGINTTSICLNNDCQTNWPTSTGGSGNVTAIGNAFTFPVFRNGSLIVNSNVTITSNGAYLAFTRNQTNTGLPTSFRQVNYDQANDGTGARGRVAHEFWGDINEDGIVNFSSGTDLYMQFSCHGNITGGQDRHCTWYINSRNDSFAGKLGEVELGPNFNRKFNWYDIERLSFDQEDTRTNNGYYDNESPVDQGLQTEYPRLVFLVDTDANDSTAENFVFGRNSQMMSPTDPTPSVLLNMSWIGSVLNSDLDVEGILETDGNVFINTSNTGLWFNTQASGQFTHGIFKDNADQTDIRYGSSSDQLVMNGVTNTISPSINNSQSLGNTTHQFANIRTVAINASTAMYTPELCLNGSCQTSWPGGIAGQYFDGYTYLVWRNGSTYIAQNVTGSTLLTSTNASLVINEAIKNITTDESAGGGKIQFSCQEFLITDSIRINKSMITIEGCGSGTKINVSGFTGKAMINVTGNSVIHVTIRNMHLNGQSASGVTGIYINTPYQQGDTEDLIENIKIWEAGKYAVQIEGDTRVVQINNVYSRTAGTDGFRIEGSDHKFNMLTSEGAACNGFYIGGGNVHIINSKAFGNGATGGTNCAGMTIYGRLTSVVGSELQDNYHCGVYIDDPETYNVLLSSNVYDTNGRAGSTNNASICINNAHDITVTASQFINRDGARNQSYAFKVTGTAENMTFVANDYNAMGITPYSFSTTANNLNTTIIGNTGQNKTNQIAGLTTTGLTISGLTGSGNDYLCVTSAAVVYRSDIACA